MVSRAHYRDRLKLANRIACEGVPIDPPCDRCARMSERKVVECKRIKSTEKCGNCVRAGRRCEHEFYSEKEWERLDKAREKVDIDLVTTDDQLSSLEKESLRLQKDISKALMKHSHLRQQKKQLDDRNMKMLSHDLGILDDLDEQNPPPSPPFEGMDFSSSEGLSPSQLLNQMSSDFWAQLGITAVADDSVGAVTGNSSSCQ